MDYIAQCECGHRVRVSEFALGMRGRCGRCNRSFTVDESNATPAVQAVAAPPHAATEAVAQSPAAVRVAAGTFAAAGMKLRRNRA